MHLIVGRSTRRSVLLGLVAAAGMASLLALQQRGYNLLALALMPPGLMLLGVGLGQRDSLEIHHERGVWTLISGGEARAVLPLPGSVCLPWLTRFSCCEPGAGRRQTLWLFPDSAPADSLAALRRCLALLG